MTEERYLQFSIPGVPYSAVRIPLLEDGEAAREEIVRALKAASYFAEKFADTFPEPEEEERSEQQQSAPRQQRGNVQAVAFCPEHDMAPMKPSAPKYNPDGDKFYHELDKPVYRDGKQVKSHTLWWRLTVDADGNSNEGKVIPGVQQQQRRSVAAGRNDEEPPPYGDEDLPF